MLSLSSLTRCAVRLKVRRRVTVEIIQKRLNSSENNSSEKNDTPLRILFFGSDSFSTTCLDLLRKTKEKEPGLYETLRIVTRQPARVGRGRKVTNECRNCNACRLD
jgi:hypothetical protein